MEAMKWLIENPAQQLQVQKGEQSSCRVWPFWVLDFDNVVLVLASLADVLKSSQGITLSVKTRKASIKATIFTRCKGNISLIVIPNLNIQTHFSCRFGFKNDYIRVLFGKL